MSIRIKNQKVETFNELVIVRTTPAVQIDTDDPWFCGDPHILLKHTLRGMPDYYWEPLSIEVCLTDDDDLDVCCLDYRAQTESEFYDIVNTLMNWINTYPFNELTDEDLRWNLSALLPIPI